MEVPVTVALAQAVPLLPAGEGWWYEPKFDGHRTVMVRGAETVELYARSGRNVTTHWMDLAVAGLRLPAGTVLDGEAVIWRDGRLDFGAAQSRAASSLTRARQLAARYPASYAVWDVLQHPVEGDVRGRPYTERRALLVGLLAAVGPPIQAVPATDDYEVARAWYESLTVQGVEGVVAKRGAAAYPAGGRRGWVKVRHADTEDWKVVGYVGSRGRPRRLALAPEEGPAGRVRLSGPLAAGVAVQVGRVIAGLPGGGRAGAEGEAYVQVDTGVVVEVLAGSGRHGTLTVVRVR
ncbi:DNA ligase [Streptomyces sp. VB1]|uniref:ATP-dependent DNA ligase n=1 Tax=Streptomyces sp. VB1 TaxID=2986803 RepID=UPI002242096D|nr:DNA ligase [Streptomyces sp. VB1]UZI33934.1 DNA ligase [Streptomyces sp. VB1]